MSHANRKRASWIAVPVLLSVLAYVAYSEREAKIDRQYELEAMAEVQEVLHAFINFSNYGMGVLDYDDLVKLWNPALERLTGYTEAEMIGKTIERVMTREEWVSHEREFSRAVTVPRSQSQVIEKPCKVLTKDGREVPVQVRIYMVRPKRKGAKPYSIAFINPVSTIVKLPENP